MNRNKLSKDAGRSSDFTNLSFPEMGPHAMSFSLMEKLIQIEQVGEETLVTVNSTYCFVQNRILTYNIYIYTVHDI